eukprot:541480-Rhodomonas_salina.1
MKIRTACAMGKAMSSSPGTASGRIPIHSERAVDQGHGERDDAKQLEDGADDELHNGIAHERDGLRREALAKDVDDLARVADEEVDLVEDGPGHGGDEEHLDDHEERELREERSLQRVLANVPLQLAVDPEDDREDVGQDDERDRPQQS